MKNKFMLFWIFSVVCLATLLADAKTIKIAIVDTGFDFSMSKEVKLCDYGLHKNFSNDSSIEDSIGHGTHIATLIGERLKNVDYCLIIIKYYDKNSSSQGNIKNSNSAFEYLSKIDIDYVNYSSSGDESDESERTLLKKLIDKNVKIFVAAGNNHKNLDTKCNIYPACYDLKGMEVVGSLTKDGNRLESSNYGKVVNSYRIGENVVAKVHGNRYAEMTGTSQATAIKLSDYVKERSRYQ